MRALVLFDGAGLAARGLRRAGFYTHGVELNPVAHYLASEMLRLEGEGKGEVTLGDVTALSDEFIETFDVIWASPPCQVHSSARTQGDAVGPYAVDLLGWSLDLVDRFPGKVVWVENVTSQSAAKNAWGTVYNAHQFGTPQNRNRVIGGHYPAPEVAFPYQRAYAGLCPCVTATEYKGCATDTRRASRFYGRRLTLEECAHHMDLDAAVVQHWQENPMSAEQWAKCHEERLTPGRWRNALYRAIGNGVPVKMAEAFGRAASPSARQLELF
jgi:site-specific DNA-cytosine methylase